MPWNIRASVDVYSSPYRVGRHYTRFYGDFYTTDGEYVKGDIINEKCALKRLNV